MRKITQKIYSAAFFLIALITNAQVSTGTGAGSILPNTPGTNANLGIGTTNPQAKLDIAGFPTDNQTYTFLDHGDSFAKSILLNIGTVRAGVNRLLTFYDVPPSNIVANGQSMLAIEDRNDANRLRHHVITNGPSTFKLSDKVQAPVFQVYEDGTYAFVDLIKPDSYLTVGGQAVWPVAHNFWVKTGTSKFDHDVFIDTNLCIGTSSFTDGTTTYKLSVKGKVRAEEVKVYNTWADYVFNPDYALPNLKEVENYIAKNGHLQNVPSAKEVTENGLALGEMAKIQQEKIEELMLYLIQQNKELSKQNSEIQELKAQVKTLLAQKK